MGEFIGRRAISLAAALGTDWMGKSRTMGGRQAESCSSQF